MIDELTAGPKTEESQYLDAMKYRGKGESFREKCNRIAFALQDSNAHYFEFREILLEQAFIPGGRIQTAMGSLRQSTPYNCFVSGTISDSYVDGPGCIMDRLKEAATTLRLGGGIGYDFSTLRPAGDLVTKLDTQAGGPLRIMRLFNTAGDVTTAAGHRFGAQMAILRVDHPDIEAFIRAKQNETEFRRFNFSIGVTDEFMEAAINGKEFNLTFKGRVYKTVDATALFETIMRSTWDWGEPGVYFLDRVNRMNNLWYCEDIASCNPCAEQPLPPYGACLLGSINLVKYLKVGAVYTVMPELTEQEIKDRVVKISVGNWVFDWEKLGNDIPVIIRSMDNVVDRARYPLAEQKGEAKNKRRMGIGVMGLANTVEAMGMPYGTPSAVQWTHKVTEFINHHCYRASIALAHEKEPFPLFDAERYLNSGFMKTMPEDIREAIARVGIRNSHLTSIAPTGTISFTADNVSGGIEPVIEHEAQRPITTPDGPKMVQSQDYGVRFLGVRGRLATEVSASEHLHMMAAAQRNVDSSISKTINVDSSMSWDEFKQIYFNAYLLGCKSCTTFRRDGLRGGLIAAAVKTGEDSGLACSLTGTCDE